eukprot:gene7535-886_t
MTTEKLERKKREREEWARRREDVGGSKVNKTRATVDRAGAGRQDKCKGPPPRTHLVLLQETKLAKSAEVPRFPGYDALRRDREPDEGQTAGGLLALMAEGLCWAPTRTEERAVDGKDTGTEVQDITIYPHGSERVRVVNLYVPPAGSPAWEGSGPFKPACLPAGACVFGDLNGHHESWDPHSSRLDARGRMWYEWSRAGGRRLLNTGAATFMGPKCRTAPD